MDDFNVSSLHESKNEWGSRLLTIMTPLVAEGLKSIFDEAVGLCQGNNEMDKYLMTFQNFISRIPKWNPSIIETERSRIVERSGCHYLEDLVTCVHIIQLKLLTAVRVGQRQKKIDITIPKLDDFVHKVYINVARKVYKNVYLFELNIPPLQVQRHTRELEIIIQECILNTVRESIPVETILRAYMDETIEEDVTEEIKEEVVEAPSNPEVSQTVAEIKGEPEVKEEPAIKEEQLAIKEEQVVTKSEQVAVADVHSLEEFDPTVTLPQVETSPVVAVDFPEFPEFPELPGEVEATPKVIEDTNTSTRVDDDDFRLNIQAQDISIDIPDIEELV
jgi:hypothetical protein